jgi:hypothetical protein
VNLSSRIETGVVAGLSAPFAIGRSEWPLHADRHTASLMDQRGGLVPTSSPRSAACRGSCTTSEKKRLTRWTCSPSRDAGTLLIRGPRRRVHRTVIGMCHPPSHGWSHRRDHGSEVEVRRERPDSGIPRLEPTDPGVQAGANLWSAPGPPATVVAQPGEGAARLARSTEGSISRALSTGGRARTSASSASPASQILAFMAATTRRRRSQKAMN